MKKLESLFIKIDLKTYSLSVSFYNIIKIDLKTYSLSVSFYKIVSFAYYLIKIEKINYTYLLYKNDLCAK